MSLVYFAHSYRESDAQVVRSFGRLMRDIGIIPSLDPPSDKLNSAKPERHLRSTDGMLAILTAREGGVSPYILYEISLALRARKPLLVFIEDSLPDGVISPRILQRRFSRRSLFRQSRDHLHALRILSSFIGDNPPPNYQPSLNRRLCLVSGLHEREAALVDSVKRILTHRGYSPEFLVAPAMDDLFSPAFQELFNQAELSICFVHPELKSEFALGMIRASFLPSILLTDQASFPLDPRIPKEYQARIVESGTLIDTVEEQITIFEEEYVDLETDAKVDLYTDLLVEEAQTAELRSRGHLRSTDKVGYHVETRNYFVEELHVGDSNVNYGQAGSMGRGSTGSIVNYDHAWGQMAEKTDLAKLATELAQLRAALKEKAETQEQDKSVLAVSEAASAAKGGNGPEVIEKLTGVGKWAIDIAKEMGLKFFAEVIVSLAFATTAGKG